MVPTLFDELLIRKQIKNPHPVAIDIFPRITSTIDWLKAQGTSLACSRICLAEKQTQGRGQRDRSWYGSFATNVNLSCGWLFQREIHQLEGLSLAVGLSVVRALRTYGVREHLAVKWPNDVYWQNSKLAGILVNTENETAGNTFAIVSVGINVNMTAAPDDQITQPWTSLSLILGNLQDRNRMAGLLIEQLLTDLAIFNVQGFAPFQADWAHYDYLREKTVTLKNSRGMFPGVAKGVDSRGHLLICAADGISLTHASGQLLKSEK